MKKIILFLTGLLTLTPMLFAQNETYTKKFSEAKEYEATGKSFYALVSYYDAMEAEPTEKAEEALEAYQKLSELLKSGKPVWGENLDEFDIYDGWMEIAAEYDKYWQSNSPVYFKDGGFVKGDLNMESKTASYTANLTKDYTSKYLELKEVVLSGWKKAYRSDWTKGSSSSLPLTDNPEKRTYYVKAEVKGSSGQVLYSLEQKSQTDYYDSSKYKWTVKDVSREDMKKLDGDTVSVSVSDVSWKVGTRQMNYASILKEPGKNTVSAVNTAIKTAKVREQYAQTINNIKTSFVLVEGGTFQMGGSGEYDGKPVHSVTLSSFYIAKTEVTQSQWKALMSNNPSYYSGEIRPVENVSWYDAIVFCNKLSLLDNKTPVYSVNGKTDPADWNYTPCSDSSISGEIVMNKTANGYRLPTEAEWEYAARGGKKSKAYTYSGSDSIDSVAWYYGNSGSRTHDVATKAANELGLYDMSGNVWEWCWDWYGDYGSSSVTNPTGPLSGSIRVKRGGSWYDYDWICRVANRDYYDPNCRFEFNGFRLVCSAQ